MSPSPDLDWSGQLLLSPGMVLYLGPGGSAGEHGHHAVQLIRSFDEPVELIIGERRVTTQAAVVPSGVRHAFNSEARRLALALVEPHGPRGRGIDRRAKELAGRDAQELLSVRDDGEASRVGERLLAALGVTGADEKPLSPAVADAVAYLDDAVRALPRLDAAARAAHISPSRLTHLFTAQVGIPFRRYVLWLRLRLVVEQVSAGANLTEAAIDAGFSGSSHLSRVFRATFGLSPSALLHMSVAGPIWPG